MAVHIVQERRVERWNVVTYDFSKPGVLARYVARHRYAWPGGYELYAVTDDGGVLCARCCRTEYRQIRAAHAGSGWRIVGMEAADGTDEDGLIKCDHCERRIR